MPFSLRRWFALVGLSAIAAISAASGWMLSHFMTARTFEQEARLTEEVLTSLMRVERAEPLFGDSPGGSREEFREFLDHVGRLPDVLRVNMYSRGRVMLWSSDPALIGATFTSNEELDRALAGELVAHGGERAKPEHANFDPRTAYFLEIYAPVRDDSGAVMGVIELYKTPQMLFAALRAAERVVWIGAALAGLFLYACLYWMLRRADNLIRVQHERLVQAETLAAIGEMSSAVAHGLRNPLASIRSTAELAVATDVSRWREARDIIDQVDRLESWVRELLTYSQPLAGRNEPIDVGALLRASLCSFERELERRQIHATTRIDERLPPVTADALMLGQVFNSLIANALEAIERDGRITIHVARAGARRLCVSIADSGPGMTRDQLKDAFKPFCTTKPKGVGVGLALARRIVERFGGSIRLESRPPAGTRVDVLLPAG